MQHQALVIEQTIPFDEIRRATGIRDNRTLRAACLRHDVPIVSFSRKRLALRPADYELLLARATARGEMRKGNAA